MRAPLLQAGVQATTPVVSASCPTSSDAECLSADILVDKMLKRLKHGKGAGIDGILAAMLKDSGHLLEACLLWLNCMNARHFPEL